MSIFSISCPFFSSIPVPLSSMFHIALETISLIFSLAYDHSGFNNSGFYFYKFKASIISSLNLMSLSFFFMVIIVFSRKTKNFWYLRLFFSNCDSLKISPSDFFIDAGSITQPKFHLKVFSQALSLISWFLGPLLQKPII